MKSLWSALAITALLVGMASVGTASAATETVSLGFKEDTGPEPAPLFEPAAVESPVSFTVTSRRRRCNQLKSGRASTASAVPKPRVSQKNRKP